MDNLHKEVVIEYVDAYGEESTRRVDYKNHSGQVMKAFCLESIRILSFRFDRIRSVFQRCLAPLSQDEWIAGLLGFSPEFKPCPPRPRNVRGQSVSSDSDVVLFTGFNKVDLPPLHALAETHGMAVSTSRAVTKKVDYLVCGENAGWKKLQVAEERGLPILNSEEFEHLLRTGEIDLDG